jgi:hypothetical protein
VDRAAASAIPSLRSAKHGTSCGVSSPRIFLPRIPHTVSGAL